MNNVLMKCGHSPNGHYIKEGNKYPCCVICNCCEVSENNYNLNERTAKCTYCNKETESNYNLPFFKYCEDIDFDEYYCGCYGWN